MTEDLTHTAEPTGPEPGGAADDQPAAPPGYELLAEVGRGSMGVVYRARETAFNRDVAVKLLREGY
jgi:serine/threonine protein kinase